MKTLKKRPVYLIIAILWFLALTAATFHDLDISLAIANEHSTLGRVLEVAGEPPAILFTSFNFALMSAHFLKKPSRKKRDLAFAALTLFACAGTSVFTFNKIADYLIDYGITVRSLPLTSLSLAAAMLTSGTFAMISANTERETVDRFFGTACRCAAAAAATFVIIWIFKLTWGRVRFRQLEGDTSRFTPWYMPQGFTGYYSFPSGHTANATVILTLTYYLRFLPERLKKTTPIIITSLGVWIVLVALSRVLIGAHYLSDVLFGAAITLSIVYFAKPKKK